MADQAAGSQPVIDGGNAAWSRVGALWLCCAGTLGLQYAFGALYVDLLAEFGESRATTAAVGVRSLPPSPLLPRSLSAGSASAPLLLCSALRLKSTSDYCSSLSHALKLATVSGAQGICVGVMDFFAIGAGLVMARIGERACCLLGATLTAAGLLGSSFGHSLVALYITYGLMVGVGMSLALFSGVVTVNKWFTTKRGFASGLSNTGASAGPLLFGALWSTMREAFGWRGTLQLFAACDFVILFVAAMFFTPPAAAEQEEEEDKLPQGTADAAAVGAAAVVVSGETATYAAVWKLREIRRLCLAIALMGLGVWIPAVHLIQFARDSGFSELQAERLLMLLALGSATIRVPTTYFADIVGRPRIFTAALLAYAAADVFIVLLSDHYVAFGIYAVLVGGLVGTILSLMPTLPADVVEEHQIIQGTTIVCSFLGTGTCVGPMIAGWFFDITNSYTSAFLFAAGCLVAAAAALNVPCAPCGGEGSATGRATAP